jgi:hypothetical protein
MMATLLGAVVSDALEDGRVVSGVGGQYNVVAQGFALEDARSVIVLPATRPARRRTTSNIRWSYGHTTIPRHLRDVVVTEYGIADCGRRLRRSPPCSRHGLPPRTICGGADAGTEPAELPRSAATTRLKRTRGRWRPRASAAAGFLGTDLPPPSMAIPAPRRRGGPRLAASTRGLCRTPSAGRLPAHGLTGDRARRAPLAALLRGASHCSRRAGRRSR